MNRAVEILRAVLDRFKLREPVPADIRGYIAARKREAAADVLRHYGQYGTAYGAVMAVFYGFRRLGFRPSMKQTKAFLSGCIAIALITAITIFVILLYDTKLDYRPKIIDSEKGGAQGLIVPERDDDVPHAKKKDDTAAPEKTEPVSVVRYRLGVETFSGDALEAGESRRVTDMIAGELIRLKGPEKVVLLRGRERRKLANQALLGSVEKLGSAYIITAKIVDVQSGRVTASFDESADSVADLDAACRRVAARAAGKVE